MGCRLRRSWLMPCIVRFLLAKWLARDGLARVRFLRRALFDKLVSTLEIGVIMSGFMSPAVGSGRVARQRAIGRAADSLPSFAEMRENLLQCVADASSATEREGLGWYPAAHSIAADIASEHGLTVRQAAGVIAVLSPQTGWGANVVMAQRAAADGHAGNVGHYEDATTKASRILAGEDPADVLGGRKVRSFFTNICSPLKHGAVTIDRHAVDMLCGRRGAVKGRVLDRPGAYALCAAVVRSAARDLGLFPHDLQAVAWCSWRYAHDVAYRFDGESF